MDSINDFEDLGPVVAEGCYRLKWTVTGRGHKSFYLESLESYPFEVAPDRYVSGPKAGQDVPGRWGAGFQTPLGWIGASCCLGSEAEAERSAESWRRSEGRGRIRAEIRRWRDRDGSIRLIAEGKHLLPLSESDRATLWDYLESIPGPEPEPEPEARRLDPRLQAEIDRSETYALLELERTPMAPAFHDRNPGGRCQECGYTHGHRMDCCFA